MLMSLVGIPWLAGGRDEAGIDCIGLALLAQKRLWGRHYPWPHNYIPGRDTDQEEAIYSWLPSIAEPCDGPEVGGLVVMWLSVDGQPFGHIGTIVDTGRMLHTSPGGSSRVARFSGAYRRRTREFFRAREEKT